ncbi:MAG: helix-turn-helix transcriptional regulator [Gammaproteobacteria bacterium]
MLISEKHSNIINSNCLTEQDAEKLFADSAAQKLIYWFRSCDGINLNATDRFLPLVTKKSFSSTKEIINKHECDLYQKEHWPYFDLWNLNNDIAYKSKFCHTIEPCFWRNQPAYAICHKRAVVDRSNRIIGSLGQAVEIIDRRRLNFLKDSIDNCLNKYAFNETVSFKSHIHNPDHPLTNRESECLFYILRGRSAKSIAQVLNISAKTVEFHMENLKNKFDCVNKSQLIEKAMELGFAELLPMSLVKTNLMNV